jgi:uncharacterized SAM-binding protein YcdF (DUF218 family)
MIYLHKILPLVFLPIGLTISLMIVGLLWRKKMCCWAALGLIFLAAMPVNGKLAMRMAEAGQNPPGLEALERADAIVVLAGGLVRPAEGHLAQWTEALVNRFEAGVGLYKAGKAPVLLLTNGRLPWQICKEPIETSLLERARQLGVAPERLKTTRIVENTAREAEAVAEQLLSAVDGGSGEKIILVTSAFHMRRAKLLFERSGFRVTPFPADFDGCRKIELCILDFFPSAFGLEKTETALREFYGYLYYRFLG